MGLLEKQNVSNDGRLSVSAASYLHSEKLSGAALSGSRHGPRRSYFSLLKKRKTKGRQRKENHSWQQMRGQNQIAGAAQGSAELITAA